MKRLQRELQEAKQQLDEALEKAKQTPGGNAETRVAEKKPSKFCAVQ